MHTAQFDDNLGALHSDELVGLGERQQVPHLHRANYPKFTSCRKPDLSTCKRACAD